MRDYTKIKAFQIADDFAVLVYTLTKRFPKDERYGMTSQLRRAVYSIASNIAEGSARSTAKDYLHFLHIAFGSLNEAHYFIHLAKRLNYISRDTAGPYVNSIDELSRCLTGLIKAVSLQSKV